jgi:hypothetical protein
VDQSPTLHGLRHARHGVRLVPQKIHVQRAIADVPVGQKAYSGAIRDCADAFQQLPDALARHDDVLGKPVLRQPAHGMAHFSPRRPQPLAGGGFLRDEHLERPALVAAFGDARRFALDFGARAVDLHEQERSGSRVDRIAGLAQRAERLPVHELEAPWQKAACGQGLSRVHGIAHPGERHEKGDDGLGLGNELDGDFGEDGERSVAADEQGGDVVSGDALSSALAHEKLLTPTSAACTPRT